MSFQDYLFYSKKYLFLNFIIFFIPISLIIGNLVLNVNVVLANIIFLFLLLKKKIKLEISKFLIIFILFFNLYLILNIFLSADSQLSLISFFGLMRYQILALSILFIFNDDIKNFKIFSYVIFIVIMLVAIDSLIQFFFLKDIFGFELVVGHARRLTGPFGDEQVVGAYLSKLVFLSLSIFFVKDKKNTFLRYVYLIFISIVILASYERAASIMMFASLFLYLFIDKSINWRLKITLISVAFIITVFMFYQNKGLKEHFVSKTAAQFGIAKFVSEEYAQTHADLDVGHSSFWDSQWGAHYLTGLAIFKKHKFFGSGLKTFRILCHFELPDYSPKYLNIDSASSIHRCSTHPHNFYIEILSETGVVGLVLLLSFILTMFYKMFIRTILRKNNYLIAPIFCSFFSIFWPIQTTGSFFSTWAGSFPWLVIGFSAFLIMKKE